MIDVGFHLATVAALLLGATVYAAVGSANELDVPLYVVAVVGACVGFLMTFDGWFLGVAVIGSVVWWPVHWSASASARESDGSGGGSASGGAEDHLSRDVDIDFDDVGGMARLKRTLDERVLAPITSPDRHERYGLGTVGGILLYGPPGCGKTYLSRALAGESGFAFVSASPTDITSKWVGEAAANLEALFEAARENEPCLVLLDELDAIASERADMGTSSQRQMVNQLLVELQAIEDADVVVVGTTNHLEDIDDAIRRAGRFDERIEVPPPDPVARREIISIHLDGRPVANDCSLSSAVDATEGYASSDLERVVDLAARHAMSRGEPIDERHLAAAVDETASSIEGWLPRDGGGPEADTRVEQPAGVTVPATDVVVPDPEIELAAIHGRDAGTASLRERVLDPIRNADTYAPFGLDDVDGALLCGPAIRDADRLARATAGELEIPFVALTPRTIGERPGRSQIEVVADVVSIARANEPCVLLVSNLDRLAPAPTSVRQGVTFADRFAGFLDGLGDDDVVVLGSASGRDAVAPPVLNAAPFDERVEIPPPDADTRRRVLRDTVDDRVLDPSFDWKRAVAAVDGLPCADVRAVGRRAARAALRAERPLTSDIVESVAREYARIPDDDPALRYIA